MSQLAIPEIAKLRRNRRSDSPKRYFVWFSIIVTTILYHQGHGNSSEWFEGSCAKLQEEFRRSVKHDSRGNPISFQDFEKSRYVVTGMSHACNGIVRVRYLDGERWCYAIIEYLPRASKLTMNANPHYCCRGGPCSYNPK